MADTQRPLEQQSRTWRATRVIRLNVIGWAFAHAVISGLLIYGFLVADRDVLRIAIAFMVGIGPFFVACTLLQARAEWKGADEPEMSASIAGIIIVAAGIGLAWYLSA